MSNGSSRKFGRTVRRPATSHAYPALSRLCAVATPSTKAGQQAIDTPYSAQGLRNPYFKTQTARYEGTNYSILILCKHQTKACCLLIRSASQALPTSSDRQGSFRGIVHNDGGYGVEIAIPDLLSSSHPSPFKPLLQIGKQNAEKSYSFTACTFIYSK